MKRMSFVAASMYAMCLLVSKAMASPPNFLVLFVDDAGINQFKVDKPAHFEGYTGDNGRWSIRNGVGTRPCQYAPDAPGAPTCNTVLSAEAIGGQPLDVPTTAEELKTVGYRTGMIGKWHLGQRPEYMPFSRGFDMYHGLPASQDMGTSFWEPKGGSEFQPTPIALFANRTVVEQPAGLDHICQSYADSAKAFIENAQVSGEPWYLYASFNHVHLPNSCSPKFCGSSKRGPVGDAIQEVDDAVGQILAAVEASGAYNDTIVFFTSDNGAPLSNDKSGNLPLRGGKTMVWSGGFKEPGIIRWPGVAAPGSSSEAVASTMDIHVTIMKQAGVPPRPGLVYDGIDLEPVAAGTDSQGHTEYFFYHAAQASNASGELFAVQAGDYKAYWATYGSDPPAPYKNGNHDPPLLFNLALDAAEDHPINATTPEYAAAMAVIDQARRDHLATIDPNVVDQNGRGSADWAAICADPESKKKFPNSPNCTLTPANWKPADICDSKACLGANPSFRDRCK